MCAAAECAGTGLRAACRALRDCASLSSRTCYLLMNEYTSLISFIYSYRNMRYSPRGRSKATFDGSAVCYTRYPPGSLLAHIS